MGAFTDNLVRLNIYSDKNLKFYAYDYGISKTNFMFTSYAHADRERVIELLNFLNSEGINVWYDQGIRAGKNLDDEIMAAIEKCSCFVLFLTRKSITRTWVLKEAEYAKKFNKNIIAVFLDKISQEKIPDKLKSLTTDTISHINLYRGITNPSQQRSQLVSSLREYNCAETNPSLLEQKKKESEATAKHFEEVDEQRRGALKTIRKSVLGVFIAIAAVLIIYNYFVQNPLSFDEENDNPQNNQVSSVNAPEITDEITEVNYPAPNFTEFSASSSIDNSKKEYNQIRAFDGDLTTCWQEYVSGAGKGEWIMCSADTVQYVNSIKVYPGHCKSSDSYNNNGRPRTIKIEIDSKQYTLTLTDSYRTPSTITFDKPIACTWIKLTLTDVITGDEWDDTAISEIIIE